MKSKVTAPSSKVFKPFTLSVEVETLAEAYALRGIKGANTAIASSVVRSANQMSSRSVSELSDFYSSVFLPVERELFEQGYPC